MSAEAQSPVEQHVVLRGKADISANRYLWRAAYLGYHASIADPELYAVNSTFNADTEYFCIKGACEVECT
jgi:hypothetical protein